MEHLPQPKSVTEEQEPGGRGFVTLQSDTPPDPSTSSPLGSKWEPQETGLTAETFLGLL